MSGSCGFTRFVLESSMFLFCLLFCYTIYPPPVFYIFQKSENIIPQFSPILLAYVNVYIFCSFCYDFNEFSEGSANQYIYSIHCIEPKILYQCLCQSINKCAFKLNLHKGLSSKNYVLDLRQSKKFDVIDWK